MSDPAKPPLTRLHLKLGWVWISIFCALGLLLEALHGFKASFYLDVGMEARRLMWTLAHTHGTLLGLLNIAFALTLPQLKPELGAMVTASKTIVVASVLLPIGFFLGGLFIHGGDPGIAVVLAPIGGLALVVGVALVAWQTNRSLTP